MHQGELLDTGATIHAPPAPSRFSGYGVYKENEKASAKNFC